MIIRVESPDERARLAREVLESLPEWFGIPESTEEYIRACRELPVWADMEDGCCRGFIAMKQTSACAAELHVMGVRQEHHREGTGRKLFRALREEASARGLRYLHVKTVRMGTYEIYDRTNLFYQSLGFEELECLPELWDEHNPCQIYIMNV